MLIFNVKKMELFILIIKKHLKFAHLVVPSSSLLFTLLDFFKFSSVIVNFTKTNIKK